MDTVRDKRQYHQQQPPPSPPNHTFMMYEFIKNILKTHREKFTNLHYFNIELYAFRPNTMYL